MHNIFLVARREYLERIRAKSFLVMTVLIPLLMGGLVGGLALVNRHTGELSRVAVITDDKDFAADLGMELSTDAKSPINVETYALTDTAAKARLDAELQRKDSALDGYLEVKPSADKTARPGFQWHSKSKADVMGKARISGAIRSALTREALSHKGMGAADVNALLEPIELESPSAGGGQGSSAAAFASAYGMFFLMYFVILFYGMNVARSIVEEKTSRIFEVLLATIRPEEMLAGKVIGVGAVGLTQVGIWIVCAAVLLSMNLVGAGLHIMPSAGQAVFFVVFFLLGYLLYSSVAAALGAMTNSEQELQPMNFFLMLPLIACSAILIRVMSMPDSPVSKVFSFIPFCTPLIMYTRIVVGKPSGLDITISILEMVVTIGVILWVASRIYRVGILMYGKKPNLPEIMRWLRYS